MFGVAAGQAPGSRVTLWRVFELVDVGALAPFGVDPLVIEAGAEVGLASFGVGEQVPDDDEDGSDGGDDGFLGAVGFMSQWCS